MRLAIVLALLALTGCTDTFSDAIRACRRACEEQGEKIKLVTSSSCECAAAK